MDLQPVDETEVDETITRVRLGLSRINALADLLENSIRDNQKLLVELSRQLGRDPPETPRE
jgi:hypothetical protein